jgi:ATP/maltotriose-dependent transcriptional regulator MalT
MESRKHDRALPVRERTPDGQRLSRFVGRERELDLLCSRLEAAGRGEGGVVLVSGEPGIGKSRLLLEIEARAQAAGWLVLSGRAYDTEGMPPYLAFAEAIGQYLRSAADDEAGRRLAAAAREVAFLVPELAEHLPDAGDHRSLGPEATRYRLFQAVSDFFLRLSATSEANGLLLCLDDLHWADRSTLLLFQHLARKLQGARLLVVGAFRTEEVVRSRPLFDVLAELARGQQDQRLALARLSPAETSSLVASLSGETPPTALAAAIHHQTEGNPFFVQEVVRHLQGQEHGLAGAGTRPEDWGLSEGVREVIGRRLSRLGVETQRLLESAAVLGDGFDAALLRTVASSDAAAATQTLEEAEQAGMLREQANSYVFGHPLIRQVIYEGLSLPRRQELHLRAAEAIETIHAARLDPHLAALATHYRLAGAADPEKVIDYATRAGDRAAAAFAFDEALRLYDMALETLELRGDGGPEAIAAELGVKRGNALSGLGRWTEARAAYETATAGLSDQRRADVLLMLANTIWRDTGDDVASSRRYAGLALDLAVGLGRRDLEAAALALLAQCDWGDGEIKSSLARYEKAYSLGENLPGARQHQGFPNFPVVLYLVGRIDEAIERSRETLASAREAEDATSIILQSANLGLALTAAGRYAEALGAFAEARERARAHGGTGVRQVLARAVGMSTAVHMEVFDFARAEATAEEARDIGRSSNNILPVVSEGIDLICIYTSRGELGRADALAREVVEQIELGTRGHRILWRGRLAAARAELALARNDWREALSLAGDSIELARAMGRPKYEALSLTARGRALAGLGRKREAIGDLQHAVAVARPVGNPAMLVRLAASLLAVEGDAALATEARQAADRVLGALPNEDMRRSFEAAEAVQLVCRLTGAKGAHLVPARPSYPDGLTEREVEVLRLIAQGKSNREIGAELVLSLRTVERHIVNIYSKLGIHSKAQATAYAFTHGLAQPL